MVSIQDQMHLFLITMVTGGGLGLLYDGFRIFRKAIPHFDLVTNLEDLLYWVTVAVTVFYILFSENYGEVRGFAFLGILLGGVLYFLLVSPWLMKISTKIIEVVKRCLGWVLKIIFAPIRKIQRGMRRRARRRQRQFRQKIKNVYLKMKKI